jgi:hypothetical protein
MSNNILLKGTESLSIDRKKAHARIIVFNKDTSGDYPINLAFRCINESEVNALKTLFERAQALDFSSSLCANQDVDITQIVIIKMKIEGYEVSFECLSDNPINLNIH